MNPTVTRILIIRHGEKPGDAASESAADGPHLSVRGQERAAALSVHIPATFGTPDFLMATQQSRHSVRPIETITPLARALGLQINEDHADDDFAGAAHAIVGKPNFAGKLVLICWHHGKIPQLARAFGAIPPVDPWPGAVFDRVWSLEVPATTPAAQNLPVKNIPQMLLFGDSSV
jgi:hypothetical protein